MGWFSRKPKVEYETGPVIIHPRRPDKWEVMIGLAKSLEHPAIFRTKAGSIISRRASLFNDYTYMYYAPSAVDIYYSVTVGESMFQEAGYLRADNGRYLPQDLSNQDASAYERLDKREQEYLVTEALDTDWRLIL